LARIAKNEGWQVTGLDLRPAEGVLVRDAAEVPLECFDAAFLNAGIVGRPGRVWEVEDEAVWATNFWAVRRGIARIVPHWLERQHPGRIVITASMGAHAPLPFMGDYAAAKAAVAALAECLHHELQAVKSAIRVSIAFPSFTATALGEALTGSVGEKFRALIDGGVEVDPIARRIWDGAAAGEFHIYTHEGSADFLRQRQERVLRGEAPELPRGRRVDELRNA
jgi:NAD(P)-dependent dehydrogenase (short-subunit alcohol dehydrogenase family)